MRIKMPGGKVFKAIVHYEHAAGIQAVISLGSVAVGPGQVEGYELVEANPAELAALRGAGYGSTLAGVRELLEASGNRVKS